MAAIMPKSYESGMDFDTSVEGLQQIIREGAIKARTR